MSISFNLFLERPIPPTDALIQIVGLLSKTENTADLRLKFVLDEDGAFAFVRTSVGLGIYARPLTRDRPLGIVRDKNIEASMYISMDMDKEAEYKDQSRQMLYLVGRLPKMWNCDALFVVDMDVVLLVRRRGQYGINANCDFWNAERKSFLGVTFVEQSLF